MIEISGLIHEFYIGKTQEKSYYSNPVLKTYRYEKCRDPTDHEKKIGEIAKRFHPFKSIITKMKFWSYIQFFDPSVHPESYDTREHHYSKSYSKNCQRSRFSIRIKIFRDGKIHLIQTSLRLNLHNPH